MQKLLIYVLIYCILILKAVCFILDIAEQGGKLLKSVATKKLKKRPEMYNITIIFSL